MPDPIVIVEIDCNSRVRVLRTEGVHVGVVDRRGDSASLTLLPDVDEVKIMKLIDQMQLISPKSDDATGTAANLVRQLRLRQVVVAGMAED